MSVRTVSTDVEQIAERILRQFRADVGEAWDGKLTPAEQGVLQAVAGDVARVLVLALAGRDDEARRERAHVEAQLRNVASIEAARLSRQLWAAVDRAARGAITVAVGLI